MTEAEVRAFSKIEISAWKSFLEEGFVEYASVTSYVPGELKVHEIRHDPKLTLTRKFPELHHI